MLARAASSPLAPCPFVRPLRPPVRPCHPLRKPTQTFFNLACSFFINLTILCIFHPNSAITIITFLRFNNRKIYEILQFIFKLFKYRHRYISSFVFPLKSKPGLGGKKAKYESCHFLNFLLIEVLTRRSKKSSPKSLVFFF